MTEPTTAADYAKILAGAKMYLEVFRDRPDKTGEFVDGLRCRLGWSPSEITALQKRAADILLEQEKQELGTVAYLKGMPGFAPQCPPQIRPSRDRGFFMRGRVDYFSRLPDQ